MGRLEVLEPAALRSRSHDLLGGPMVLGRSPDVEWHFDDPAVSRHHAVVRHYADHDEIEDLGSTAGTRVNGRPIAAPWTLRSGDVVQLATVRLRYVAGPPDRDGPPARPASAAWADATQVGSGSPPASASFEVGQQRGETISNVGRDQYNQYIQQIVVRREEGLRQAASISRVARVLVITGMALAGAGVLGFIASIVAQIGRSAQIDVTDVESARQAAELVEVGGVPVFAVAMGVAVVGFALFISGVLVQIAASTKSRRVKRDNPLPQGWPG